ncbi:MAG: 1-deoxy-D-xylulose-5-phosphate reductoisomerase [Gammaproteobacteria bacterium]|nr:1-deoxy-D-xylulose-5-phosphate reductoisomerase [Gammaproteobacteria bacterium]
MQTLTILGATGSIGLSTLNVIARYPERFSLHAVTANNNVDGLFDICAQYQPSYAVMVDEESAEQLQSKLSAAGLGTKVLAGEQALIDMAGAPEVTTVMAAIVGGAGLLPTLKAAETGKRILLANKEALVMSGDLLLRAVKQSGAMLLPVDSEHNAIFQALPETVQKGAELKSAGVEKILLTGSGGPFLTKNLNEFAQITPEMAVAHPNWSMGAKISVDSATMMNKGLEFIEARLLFNASFEQIEVLIHPQSIIHSMVSYSDGSVLAQMGQPDMRTPIAHTLSYPDRIKSGVAPLDFTKVASFTFCQPDFQRFPNLKLALDASRQGQGATTVLNASNEIAVASFLKGQISFLDIAKFNEKALIRYGTTRASTLADIIALDQESRQFVSSLVAANESVSS